MPSEEQLRRELSRLKDEEYKLARKRADHERAATKARADARTKRDRALRASSPASVRGYLRDAERLETKAADSERKLSDVVGKLAANARKQDAKVRSMQS